MSEYDELRAAARELRKQADGGFCPMLADWLDLTAETPAFRTFVVGQSGSHVGKNIRAALAVARAINGGTS